MTVEKFDRIAERYSATDYADAERYYARRADVLATLIPAGASVLDIACGDGGLGRHLLARDFDYRGVDASERMVEVARRALGDERVAVGSFGYTPPRPVDATTIFRSLYLVPDRRAFFAHVRSFSTRIVFDFDPRAYERGQVLADLEGWREVRVRPFLTPQRGTLPTPVQRALWALEPLPGAQLLTHVRFPLLVSATA